MGALYDLVGFSTTTTGTGTLTVGAALPGHLTLAGAGIPDGTTVSYGISSANGSAREVGNGVVGGSGTTLTRVLSSSSTGSLLNLSGTSEVTVTVLAADIDGAKARANHTGTQASSTITMATARLLGRTTAGSGAAEEISVGSGLSLTAGTLSATGGGGSPGGSSGQLQYNNAGAFGGATNVSVQGTGGGTLNCLAVGDSGANPGFVSVRGSPSTNGPHGMRFWSATDTVAMIGYDQGTSRQAGIGFLDFGQTTLRMAITCVNGDLKTQFGGPIYPKQYTTATRPAWVNGAVIFDTDIDKVVIGGVSGWEAVTST